MRGINANDVQQIGRAHRPAKLFFHYFIDFAEVRAVAQQLAETGEVGEQHAVNKEAGAVVNHNRRFAHFAGPGDHFRDGFVRAFLAANDLDQRHPVHRVKEVHTAEVFRALQYAGQLADGNGGGIRSQHGIRADFVFRFRQHRFFHFRILNNGFDHDVHAFKAGVIQGWLNSRNDASHLETVDFAALKLFI